MLHSLTVGNFKSLRERQELPLAPLTLIYGPNSAGKSSILQALALLTQTASRSAPDELVVRGPAVDFGSFVSLVTDHDLSAVVTLGFSLSPETRPFPRLALFGSGESRAELNFRWNAQANAVVQESLILAPFGGPPATFHRQPPRKRPAHGRAPRLRATYRVDESSKHALLGWLTPSPSRLPRASSPGEDLEQLSRELHDRYGRPASDFLRLVHPMFVTELTGPGLVPTRAFQPGGGPSPLEEVSKLLAVLSAQASSVFGAVSYLGPLRRPPERFYEISGTKALTVGPEGEHVPELLLENDDLLPEVNEWFAQLDIPYRLTVSHVPLQADDVAVGSLLVLSLRDVRSGVHVTPRDVGFGISQVLPIVVELLLSRNRTICIEQPEIHLHPRLQAQLGDLLLAAVSPDRGNQVIVETHSESLMLRVQRRLRELRKGTAPAYLARRAEATTGAFSFPELDEFDFAELETLPAAERESLLQQLFAWRRYRQPFRPRPKLSARDVSVLYVESLASGRAEARQLRLDDDGEFLDPWPDGFFDERLEELPLP